jgi:hypothetical protein
MPSNPVRLCPVNWDFNLEFKCSRINTTFPPKEFFKTTCTAMNWEQKSSEWTGYDFSRFQYRIGEATVVAKSGAENVEYNPE